MRKVLFLHDTFDYSADMLKKLKGELEGKKRVGYLTLNKTFFYLEESMDKNGIDFSVMHFFDFVTPRLFGITKKEHCTFFDDLKELDAVEKTIQKKIIELECDTFIIDSISSMITYHDDAVVIGFIETLTRTLDNIGANLITFALKKDLMRPCVRHAEENADYTLL